MSFRLFSFPLVYEGARLARIGKDQVSKIKIQIFIPIIEFIAAQKPSFSSKLPQFSINFIFRTYSAENSNSSIFKMISRFCSSHRVVSNSTFQISKVHDNFTLGSIICPEVIVGTLSLGFEKLKFSKFSVSDQTS
jgi:hypothetical protein